MVQEEITPHAGFVEERDARWNSITDASIKESLGDPVSEYP